MKRTVLLGDVATINMGQSPKSEFYNSVGEGLPFMQGVRTFGRMYPKIDMWCTMPTKVADAGDVLLSVRAPVGDLNFAPERMCIGRGLASLKSRNNKFLYYLIEANKERLISSQTGSVFGSVNATMLKNFKLTVPTDNNETQDKIADILGTLDEKIELNRKMNETLEQIGQALFRHYFIDNPEAEKWEKSTIGAHYSVLLGGTPSRSKKEYWEGGSIGWINSGKVNEFRITEPSELITEEALKKSAAKLLPKGTTVIAITGATLGQYSRLEKPFAANQSVIGLVLSGNMSNEFLYYWIGHSINKLIGHQTGGAQQHINRNDVFNFKLPLPDDDTLSHFQGEITPIMEQISIKCLEIQTLTALRDTLLPRLISGKVKV